MQLLIALYLVMEVSAIFQKVYVVQWNFLPISELIKQELDNLKERLLLQTKVVMLVTLKDVLHQVVMRISCMRRWLASIRRRPAESWSSRRIGRYRGCILAKWVNPSGGR